MTDDFTFCAAFDRPSSLALQRLGGKVAFASLRYWTYAVYPMTETDCLQWGVIFSKFIQFRSRQQFNEPINEYSYLVTEVPVRRIDYIERDPGTRPFPQDMHQLAI